MQKKFIKVTIFSSRSEAEKEIWVNRNLIFSVIPLTVNSFQLCFVLSNETGSYNCRGNVNDFVTGLNGFLTAKQMGNEG